MQIISVNVLDTPGDPDREIKGGAIIGLWEWELKQIALALEFWAKNVKDWPAIKIAVELHDGINPAIRQIKTALSEEMIARRKKESGDDA